MRGKKISLKLFLVCLLIVSLFFLSLVFFFRKEWLDSAFEFFGVNILKNNTLQDEIELSLSFLEENGGESLLYLKTEDDVSITGVELSLAKDVDLEIVDFICEEPFECVNFMWGDDRFYVAAVTPMGLDTEFEESIAVGRIFYEGVGSLYVTNENSFVTTSCDVDISLNEGEYVLSF